MTWNQSTGEKQNCWDKSVFGMGRAKEVGSARYQHLTSSGTAFLVKHSGSDEVSCSLDSIKLSSVSWLLCFGSLPLCHPRSATEPRPEQMQRNYSGTVRQCRAGFLVTSTLRNPPNCQVDGGFCFGFCDSCTAHKNSRSFLWHWKL